MRHRFTPFLAGLLLAAPAIARADLPGCAEPRVGQQARSQFNTSQELRDPPGAHRARALDGARETGREPYTHPLAPPGFERRFCEATLRLDDGSMLPVFIRITGRDGGGRNDTEALEVCWEDARFPRFIASCRDEKAPSRR